MKKINFFVIVLIILLPDCVQQSKTITERKIIEVKLVVDAPFSIAEIEINDQNVINYKARPHKPWCAFVSNKEGTITGLNCSNGKNKSDHSEIRKSSTIMKSQFNELVDLIENNNFWSFEEKYFEEYLMDATTYIVTVKRGDQIKSVSCYGECPEEVIEIREKIVELWGKEILNVGV